MTKNDPANYRAMQVPHASADAATDALEAFIAEVDESRKKHRIKEVTVVVEMAALAESGEEGVFCTSQHLGNAMNKTLMLASAYGAARKSFDDAVAVALKGR